MSVIDSGILDMVLISSKRIGPVTIAVTIKESHFDELAVTEHPVEQSANISDHAFMLPREVEIEAGWGNSIFDVGINVAQALISNGMPVSTTPPGAVYAQLLALQESRVPFDVTTSKRQYSNMLVRRLMAVTDPETFAVLKVRASLREVILVSTQVTRLPPQGDQADPSSTAETANSGTKAAVPATPAPGGAQPIPVSLTDGITSGSL